MKEYLCVWTRLVGGFLAGLMLGNVSSGLAATRISFEPDVQSITAGQEVSMSCMLEPDGDVYGVGIIVKYDPDHVGDLTVEKNQLPQGASLVSFDDGKGTLRVSLVSSRELVVTDPKMFDISMKTTGASHGELPVQTFGRVSDGEGNRVPVELVARSVSVFNPDIAEEEPSEDPASDEEVLVSYEARGRADDVAVSSRADWSDAGTGVGERRGTSVAGGEGGRLGGAGGWHRRSRWQAYRKGTGGAGRSVVELSEGLLAMMSSEEREELKESLKTSRKEKELMADEAGVKRTVSPKIPASSMGKGNNYSYKTSFRHDGKLVLDLQVDTGGHGVGYALVDGRVSGRRIRGNGSYSYTIEKMRDTARFALVLGSEFVWIDL